MTVYTRVGLAIDQTTNDLYLEDDGNLALATNAKAVGEHARQRLQTYLGEWFLDTSCGVPWLDQIFGQAYDSALAESVVKAELLDTDGVTDITSFSVSFDRATRGVIIHDVEVLTMFDEVVNV
jgi:hypothetical protein